MPSSIKDYRQLIEKPWGRMFYDMIYRQIDLSNDKPLKILDFGAGFCVTAAYYSKHHTVTAIEPNKEMLDYKVKGDYSLVYGGVEMLKGYDDYSFDVIICHNVLEYAENKEQILKELARILKKGGKLSVVKHNIAGRIIANAVFGDDPKSALELLNNGDDENSMFGNRNTYSNESLIDYVDKLGLSINNIYGIRTFFSLSSNNEIKFTDEWYSNMLELEMKVCDIDEYKNIAFFNHLIFTSGCI